MKKEYKNIKAVGLAICAFDTEHVANIVSELREFLDYVVVGIQNTSYNGEKLDKSDENELRKLKEGGLVDEVIYLTLDMSKEPRAQETYKRNLLIDDCQAHGCSHAIVIDSDEFYSTKEFSRALDTIDKNNLEITYCRYVNYYHDYKHYLVYPFAEGNYVPFVSSVKYRFQYNGIDFPKPSDPTRRYHRPRAIGPDGREYYTVGFYEFPWNDLKMHHLSWLRSNIRKKLYNWSAKTCFDNYVELIDKAVKYYEEFDENTDKTYEAHLLFNTPGNKVDVEAWPKQYIHPKFDFRNKVEKLPQEKNILILAMSMDHPQYKEQEDAIRETWKKYAEENHQNIKVLFYKGTDKESYLDGDTLYIKNDDSLDRTYSKTLDAIAYVEDHELFDYDYIFRTNTSTYVNIEILNDFVSSLDIYEFMLYCSEIDCCWWSKMHFYAKGNALLMNKFYVERIMYCRSRQMEEQFGCTDDCIIGASINLYCGKLKIDHTKHIKSFGSLYELDEDLTHSDEECKDKIAISIKTVLESNDPINDERKHDAKKMRQAHERFLRLNEQKFFEVPKEFNKTVLLVEDKAEWLTRGPERCNTRYITSNMCVPYEEALKKVARYGLD